MHLSSSNTSLCPSSLLFLIPSSSSPFNGNLQIHFLFFFLPYVIHLLIINREFKGCRSMFSCYRLWTRLLLWPLSWFR
jgi:hypothetical protein